MLKSILGIDQYSRDSYVRIRFAHENQSDEKVSLSYELKALC